MSRGNGNGFHVYAGLAGETAPGRVVDNGLFRLAEGADDWEELSQGLPAAPAIRALAVHPARPGVIYAGTQEGPYLSVDHGESWGRVPVPDHGLPVWSVLFHPRDPETILIGYENAAIHRSDDGGASWRRLPVHVRFPDITTAPGSNPAKRVLMMDASPSDPDLLYAAIEVGGTLRSTDGGQSWENLSEGQYLNDDPVDMHGVLVSRWHPGKVIAIGRAGMFHSADGGDHWRLMPLEPSNEKGQIYCRDIAEVPGNPRCLWVAAGGNFQSDVGLLLASIDGGDSWRRVDMGVRPENTLFALAFDERRPEKMAAATNGGQIFASPDGGENWDELPPLPSQGNQIYALARG